MQYFYFKPTMSERKRKCSGNIDGTTILFLKVCLVQLCLICQHMDYSQPGSSCHEDSPDKNTGVGCHAHLQGIFLIQGSNPHFLCLLHWQDRSFTAEPPGMPLRNTIPSLKKLLKSKYPKLNLGRGIQMVRDTMSV